MNPMIRVFFIVVCAVTALAGDTAIHRAVREGDVALLRARLQAGGDPNERDASGRTPLIEAAELGQVEVARVLISAGADLNARPRGWGSALEMAERTGHTKLAEILRQAGARTFGRSVGDKVCVRPWKGDGYCGTVEAIDKNAYRIRVTEIVGCKDGCPARGECSAGKPVGGAEGLHAGDAITTVSWCLTHTGVQR
jgi:Ankyrin repeats (3 copies)